MTQIELVAEKIRSTPNITVLTGAGMSAESGVPTFRGGGADNLWNGRRPEELANPDAFQLDPKLVWKWYDWRRQVIAKCQPNEGHLFLSTLSRHEGFTLITQNVDGLHERCGTMNVVCFHGSIWEMKMAFDSNPEPRVWRNEEVPLNEIPPLCPVTHKLARPNIVWFGEPIDPKVVGKATRAASSCDLFITIGTSARVHPAADLIELAKASDAFTIEINPEQTPASGLVDMVIQAAAVEALSAIKAKL
ncbi:MAG: NAD-dependent deacylase [Verrucomicrobiota bacterium]